jgi:hypothetical protein
MMAAAKTDLSKTSYQDLPYAKRDTDNRVEGPHPDHRRRRHRGTRTPIPLCGDRPKPLFARLVVLRRRQVRIFGVGGGVALVSVADHGLGVGVLRGGA